MARTARILAMVCLTLGMAWLGSPPARAASGGPTLAWSHGGSTITSFDYGTLTVGGTSSQTFTLANTGSSSSGTVWVTLPVSPSFSITADSCSGISMGPRRSCSVTVEYAPASSGESDSPTLTARGEHAVAGLALAGRSSGCTVTNDYGCSAIYGARLASASGYTDTFMLTASISFTKHCDITALIPDGSACEAYPPNNGASGSGTYEIVDSNGKVTSSGTIRIAATPGSGEGLIEWGFYTPTSILTTANSCGSATPNRSVDVGATLIDTATGATQAVAIITNSGSGGNTIEVTQLEGSDAWVGGVPSGSIVNNC